MALSKIFDVFSRRREQTDTTQHAVPITTRDRVLMWCGEIFSNQRSYGGSGDYTNEFWTEINRSLRMRHGRTQLSDGRSGVSTIVDDTIIFLRSCGGAEFLDFLEYIFRVECYFHVSMEDADVVAELNEILRADNLAYHVTDFVKREIWESESSSPFGRIGTVIETLAFPQVVCRENDVSHTQSIEPALNILQSPLFKNVNHEFLTALEDFRKGDFGDCLVKLGSAFESVMKVICDEKKWVYNQTDTASALIKIILGHTSLGSYFETTLIIVATLRNRLSTAHGAGTGTRHIPRHVASYAVNMTAAAILLLTSETGLEKG